VGREHHRVLGPLLKQVRCVAEGLPPFRELVHIGLELRHGGIHRALRAADAQLQIRLQLLNRRRGFLGATDKFLHGGVVGGQLDDLIIGLFEILAQRIDVRLRLRAFLGGRRGNLLPHLFHAAFDIGQVAVGDLIGLALAIVEAALRVRRAVQNATGQQRHHDACDKPGRVRCAVSMNHVKSSREFRSDPALLVRRLSEPMSATTAAYPVQLPSRIPRSSPSVVPSPFRSPAGLPHAPSKVPRSLPFTNPSPS